MTFAELLQRLEARLPGYILDGDAAETVAKACDGRHKHPLAARIIASVFGRSGLADATAAVSRSQVVAALAPIRLEFMKDDAPAEGFRLVEKIVHAIDGAFNDEALQQKSRGTNP
ncbi:MAG: hypothetical protein ACK4N4_05210 [Burkholderiales bacterium]